MKRFLLAAAAVLVCLAAVGGTYAYYTVSSTAHNVITTGAVKIAVEEWQQTDQGMIPYPKESVAVMPGHQVSKIVNIRNLDKKCYIRARIEATILDAEGNSMVLTPKETDDMLHLNINTDFWQKKKQDEIWWYYYRALPEDTVTEPLFDTVIFDGQEMGNSYQDCTIQIQVIAQAVQADNNAETAMTAAGWPAA